MANRGKPKNGFKKGVVTNPAGRPRIPEELKKMRAMNRVEAELLLNKFTYMTRKEIAAYSKSDEATTMELLIISVITSGIKKGDQAKLNFLLDRMIGPVPRNLIAEISAPSSNAQIVARIMAANKEADD